MVSFSCEACGDVLTKKKLDSHRSRCRAASFTCIDCMYHFRGTDYRQHTSCISEAQKYQGTLFKEGPHRKGKRQIAASHDSGAARGPHLHSKQPYVEDDPEDSFPQPVVPATTKVNALDYLVPNEISSPSRRSLGGTKSAMTMKVGAPTIFGIHGATSSFAPNDTVHLEADELLSSSNVSSSESNDTDDTETSTDSLLADGAGPTVAAPTESLSLTSMLPSTNTKAAFVANQGVSLGPTTPVVHTKLAAPIQETQRSAGSKRKRTPEVLDLRAMEHTQSKLDQDTAGATPRDDHANGLGPLTPFPRLVHSGLTGGLQRMLSNEHPLSPMSDQDSRQRSPLGKSRAPSPPTREIKAIKPGKALKNRLQETEQLRGRSEETPLGLGALMVPARRKSRRTSDESRPRKHVKHKVQQRVLSDHSKGLHRTRDELLRSHPGSLTRADRPLNDIGDGAMVLYKGGDRAALFLSMVTKGPESLKGCSINKALKRYHRERRNEGDGAAMSIGPGKDSRYLDEKELWKSLRLRRNDRGEVVVVMT